jgi:hypothetical protein
VRTERAIMAAGAAAIVCILGLVATISPIPEESASRPFLPPTIHDRYAFYVVPLYLIFFVFWLSRRRDFSTWILVPLLAAGALVPLILPYSKVHTNAGFDALALIPWHNKLIAERHVPAAMAITVGILSLLLLVRRRSFVLLQIGLVAVGLWIVGMVAQRNMDSVSLEIASSRVAKPSWVDASVPAGARVAVLWKRAPGWSDGRALIRQQALWKAEFFNTAIKRFFYVGSPMYFDLPETTASLRHGRVALPGLTRYRYLLVAAPTQIDGRVIARDKRAHLVLYRLREPA